MTMHLLHSALVMMHEFSNLVLLLDIVASRMLLDALLAQTIPVYWYSELHLQQHITQLRTLRVWYTSPPLLAGIWPQSLA